jgi:peroxisomal 2,4-dienoyl-CoA reductase
MFANRVIFATGATERGGINFAIVRQFVERGGRAFLVGRRRELLDERVADLGGVNKARAAVADVRQLEQMQAAVKQCEAAFGAIHVTLCGAAGNFLCSAEDLSVNALRTVLEIDTIGTFVTAKACLPALVKTRGQILNITATLHFTQTPLQLHASAAKAGVDAMTRNLAVELGKKFGIRVNGIAPGAIAGTEGMSRLSGGQDVERFGEIVAMRRVGTVQDIAATAMFLLSDDASYITGQTIVVDGGAQLHTPEFVTPEIYEMIRTERARQSKKAKL